MGDLWVTGTKVTQARVSKTGKGHRSYQGPGVLYSSKVSCPLTCPVSIHMLSATESDWGLETLKSHVAWDC